MSGKTTGRSFKEVVTGETPAPKEVAWAPPPTAEPFKGQLSRRGKPKQQPPKGKGKETAKAPVEVKAPPAPKRKAKAPRKPLGPKVEVAAEGPMAVAESSPPPSEPVVIKEQAPIVAPPVASDSGPREWLHEAQSLPVSVSKDSAEHRWCEKQGLPYKLVKTVRYNPHGIAALNRKLATQYVLGHAAQDDCRTLADLWGNKRTPALAAQLRDWRTRVTVLGNPHVPADVTRRPVNPGAATTRLFDALLLVNVYDIGRDEGAPGLCPRVLRSLIDSFQSKSLYLVMHHFPEACGTVDKTGAYVRIVGGEDKVVSRPSDTDRVYGPHAACTWAQVDGAADGVAWTHLTRYGDLHVLLVKPSTQIYSELYPSATIEYKSIDIPDLSDDWTSILYSWLPVGLLRAPFNQGWVAKVMRARNRVGFVSQQLVAVAADYFRWVKYTQFSLKVAQQKVRTAMQEDPFKTVVACFPHLAQAFVDIAIAQALVQVAHADREILDGVRLVHGADIADRSRAINDLPLGGPRPAAWGWTLFTLSTLVAAAAGAYVYAKLQNLHARLGEALHSLGDRLVAAAPPLTVANFSVHTPPGYRAGVLAAALEEGMRTLLYGLHPATALVVPLAYSYADRVTLGNSFLKGLLVHGALQVLNYANPWLGLAAHVANNVLATWQIRRAISMARDVQSPWIAYREIFLEGPIEDVPVQDSTDVRVVPIFDFRVRNRTDARLWAARHTPQSRLSRVSRAGASLDDILAQPATDSYHFNFLPHNAPYFIPGLSGEVLWASLRRRLLRAVPLELHPDVGPNDAPDSKWWERFEPVYAHYKDLWANTRALVVDGIEDYLVASGQEFPRIERDEVETQWFDHLTHNKDKFIRVRAEVANNPVYVSTIPGHNKRNEQLYKRDDEWFLDPVARTILAAKPQEIYATGPSVYEASERLKRVFNYRFWEREPIWLEDHSQSVGEGQPAVKVPVHWVVGPMADTELADMMNHLRTYVPGQCMLFFVTAGDDSVIAFYDGERWHYYTGDFSQFDMSQLLPALRAGTDLLRLMGVPEADVRLLKGSYVAKLSFALKRSTGEQLTIRRDYGGRVTGHNDTSFGNNAVNGVGIIGAFMTVEAGRSAFAYKRAPTSALLEAAFREYGLKIKLRHVHDVQGITFLKYVLLWGAHPSGERALLACPLPSRILKLGKSLRDPRELYPVKQLIAKVQSGWAARLASAWTAFMGPVGSHSIADVALIAAGLAFLRDQALGIAACWLVPILKGFTTKYANAETLNDDFLSRLERVIPSDFDQYRIQVTPMSAEFRGHPKAEWAIDPEQLLLWGGAHYGAVWESHLDLAAIIANAPAFAFIAHPLFEAMARADYA